MITILYPAGAFGSTIEYCLRNFSLELESIQAQILDNGCMHSFAKEFHVNKIDLWRQRQHWTIATPLYPGFDYLDPVTTVQKMTEEMPKDQNLILIHFDTAEQVYRNRLFGYHKIGHQFEINYIDRILKNKPQAWNPAYTCVSDMQIYELREALSFTFNDTENYLQVLDQAQPSWLCVTPDDILYNFKNTVLTMLDHCGLTLDPDCEIDNFYKEWFDKQQYIIEEFQTVQKILESLQNREFYEWRPISVMSEAIVQYCLRTQGIEIACYNLNQFPTSTEELKRVMIKGTQ